MSRPPTLLGSVPDLPAEEGIRALESACDAYDHGRGVWPSSSAAARIEAMEKFISLIEPKRDQIAELLMWEIGKKRSDAQKEFDRTIDYLRDTMAACTAPRIGAGRDSAPRASRSTSPATPSSRVV